MVLNGIVIDPHGLIPAYAQLKDQIKFACAHQDIKPGDVLPSIRVLARQLNVGDGEVRRAYRELCEAGLLATERRKHVVVSPAIVTASQAGLMRASIKRSHRLIAWAAQHRLSAIALGRLLLRQALARESASPSYLFVDICRLAAETSAAKTSKAWGITVAGVSVGDFSNRWNDEARRVSAILVSDYLYDDVIEVAGEAASRAFPVRMHLDEHLRRRLNRLPARSAVVLVCSDEDSLLAGGAVRRHYEDLFDKKWRVHVKNVSEIPDLTSFVLAQRYGLALFSPLVWEKLPARAKRMVRVAPAFSEPDPQSLEEIRIAAGVLM